MEMHAIAGLVLSEPKVLNLSPLLLYTKVRNSKTGTEINRLAHKHGLNFLYEVSSGSRVAFYGHYNKRKQFIIDKYTVVVTTKQKAS